eukprot:368482_1
MADTKASESWNDPNGSDYEVTGSVAKSTSTTGSCVYGLTFVKEGIHEWVIKYEHTEDLHYGWIGIATHSGKSISGAWEAISFGVYYDNKAHICSINPSYKKETDLAMQFNDGDTIRILLNYEQKTVSFYDTNNSEIWTQTDIPTG